MSRGCDPRRQDPLSVVASSALVSPHALPATLTFLGEVNGFQKPGTQQSATARQETKVPKCMVNSSNRNKEMQKQVKKGTEQEGRMDFKIKEKGADAMVKCNNRGGMDDKKTCW